MSAPDISIASAVYRQAQRIRLPFRWKKQSYTVRPTRYGAVFMLMLMALFIGSINHNNNFGYLLTFLLGGMVLVSVAHTFANLQDISITPVPVKPVFAGSTADISFLLHSRKFPKPRITGRLDRFSSEPVDLVDNVPARINIPLPTLERGMVREKSVALGTDFPLGLVEVQKTLPVSLSVLVYPAPLPGACIFDDAKGVERDSSVAAKGGETDFSELSPYRVGDDIRRAHWKSMAAGKDLHTVKYEDSQSGGIMFSLLSIPGENVETRLGRLCHMILTVESRGMKYGLTLGDRVIGQGRGSAHKNVCLKALALYR